MRRLTLIVCTLLLLLFALSWTVRVTHILNANNNPNNLNTYNPPTQIQRSPTPTPNFRATHEACITNYTTIWISRGLTLKDATIFAWNNCRTP
jgi:hypothetical protein